MDKKKLDILNKIDTIILNIFIWTFLVMSVVGFINYATEYCRTIVIVLIIVVLILYFIHLEILDRKKSRN